MIDYFFLLCCLLSFINVEIKGHDNFFEDYMNLDNTNSIKGIFVWMIIFCHKIGYGIKNEYIFTRIITCFGQNIVTMFLFYSGFGIKESIKNKGFNYAKTLLNKSVILLLKFEISLLLYLAENIFILKNKITLKSYILSAIFRNALGNSNWFVFTIILFYLYSYLSFIFTKNHYISILILNTISFFHVMLVYNYFYKRKIHTVATTLSFNIGFYYSLIKSKIDRIIMNNDIIYFGFTSIIIFLYYYFYKINSLIYNSILNVLFALLVVLISMKIKFKNNFLNFLNLHSFSIYLLQKLIIILVFKKNIFKNNNFIQISFEFTSIIFLACLFDKHTQFINRLFSSGRKRSQKFGYNIIKTMYLIN